MSQCQTMQISKKRARYLHYLQIPLIAFCSEIVKITILFKYIHYFFFKHGLRIIQININMHTRAINCWSTSAMTDAFHLPKHWI